MISNRKHIMDAVVAARNLTPSKYSIIGNDQKGLECCDNPIEKGALQVLISWNTDGIKEIFERLKMSIK